MFVFRYIYRVSFYQKLFQKLVMCEIRTVLIFAGLLLAATGFCIRQANSKKNVGHHSEIKNESPCEKEYKKHCMNGGEC